MYRILIEIYELSSAARIFPKPQKENILNNKYCFKLEQSNDCKVKLLENAIIILNENNDVKAQVVERTLDSVYVLEVSDKTKTPKKSAQNTVSQQYMGPYYKGTYIVSKDLVYYLENQTYEPVKDKTGFDFNFDMELNWNYENPKSLNVALKEYGLIIRRATTPEKVMVLELK